LSFGVIDVTCAMQENQTARQLPTNAASGTRPRVGFERLWPPPKNHTILIQIHG
jgi:hypothetical protein